MCMTVFYVYLNMSNLKSIQSVAILYLYILLSVSEPDTIIVRDSEHAPVAAAREAGSKLIF